MKLPKISTQHLKHALRTALAAMTTYAVVTILGSQQGYWAVISVVIVMQANLGGSFQAGLNRIIGTAVGALLGASCLSILGSGAISLGLGVGLTILFCAYFIHMHESFRMAGLTATIVILLGYQSGSYMGFAAARFFEICLGVAIALAYSAFFWPSRAGLHLKMGVVKALNDEAAFFSVLLSCRMSPDCDELEERQAITRLAATRDTNRKLLAEAKKEPSGLSRSELITVSLYNFTERIAEHLLSMEYAVHFEELEALHGLVAKEMDLLAQTTITCMTRMALAIGASRDPGTLDDLKKALDNADAALTRIRMQRVLPSYGLESVMRFFSYYYNMKQVAVELTGMAERAGMLEGD